MIDSSLLAQVNFRTEYFLNAGHRNASFLGANPGTLISFLLPNLIILAGVIFLVIIILNGFYMLQDAGTGNAQQMAKHRNSFIYALAGLLLVMSAYFILQIVATSTGVNFMNPGNI